VVLYLYIDRSIANRGKIIAIMLSRLKIDVDKCIAAYTRLMKSVF
jgi:hypothetical protein